MTSAFPSSASPSLSPAPSHGQDSSSSIPVARQRSSSGKNLSHPPILHPHQTHSPTHSATGDLVQGLPEDAGGVHTSTGRGKVVLAGNPLSASSNSPMTLSPAPSVDLLAAPSSVVATPGCSPAPSSPVMTPTSALSRASSPTRSMTAASPRNRSPVPAGSRSRRQSWNTKVMSQQQRHALASGTASPVPSGTATLFERDVEFAQDHPLTGSEAIDLAAAPILSEIATLAITNDAPSSILHSSSSMTASPAASPSPMPSDLSPSTLLNTPTKASNPSHSHTLSGGALSNASTSSQRDFSPPPSLSLSPSVVGSPSSSTPGSPILSMQGMGSSSLSAEVKEIDLAGGNEPNRRLSFISYADIINSERLTDNSSPFAPSLTTSPGPSTLLPGQSPSPSTALPSTSSLLSSQHPILTPNGESENEDKTTPTGTLAHNTPRKESVDAGRAQPEEGAAASSWDIFGLSKALGSAVGAVENIAGIGAARTDGERKDESAH